MLLLALIGVGLGAQGVYALAASMVAARRQELAIRIALGATGPALVWLVLRQLIVAVVIGSGLGVLGIFTLQPLTPQWISAAVTDPAVSIALAIAVLLATTVLGGFISARSATRSPSVAWLRR
jgi:ABC-type antimicrobial peptide transport system permease subunit